MTSKSTSKSMRDGALLSDKLLVSVSRHITQEHSEDILACAKANSTTAWAEQANITDLSATGMTIEASDRSRVESFRVDFPELAKGLFALRRMYIDIVNESRVQLGWPVIEDDEKN